MNNNPISLLKVRGMKTLTFECEVEKSVIFIKDLTPVFRRHMVTKT